VNFDAESFSQRNCIGRRDSGLFSVEDSGSPIVVLIFIEVIIEL